MQTPISFEAPYPPPSNSSVSQHHLAEQQRSKCFLSQHTEHPQRDRDPARSSNLNSHQNQRPIQKVDFMNRSIKMNLTATLYKPFEQASRDLTIFLKQSNKFVLQQEHYYSRKMQTQCAICLHPTSQCIYLACVHMYCRSCIYQHIKESIKTGIVNINCPHHSCQSLISEDIIQQLLTKSQFQKYQALVEKTQQELNPKNKFCSRPDCESVLVDLEGSLHCQKCGNLYCKICRQLRHDGARCDRSLERALQQTYKSLRIKRCPSCNSPIEKESGCNHMSCSKCKYQFCWICLSGYSMSHYRYYNCCGCPWMQFQEQQRYFEYKSKQICLFLCLPVILVLVAIIFVMALPIYMIKSLIVKPIQWMNQRREFWEQYLLDKCWKCTPKLLQSILLWLLLQPRAILYSLIMTSPKIILSLYGIIATALE